MLLTACRITYFASYSKQKLIALCEMDITETGLKIKMPFTYKQLDVARNSIDAFMKFIK
jgi:hypothetical protein